MMTMLMKWQTNLKSLRGNMFTVISVGAWQLSACAIGSGYGLMFTMAF